MKASYGGLSSGDALILEMNSDQPGDTTTIAPPFLHKGIDDEIFKILYIRATPTGNNYFLAFEFF